MNFVQSLKVPICKKRKLNSSKLLNYAFNSTIPGRKLIEILQREYKIKPSPIPNTKLQALQDAHEHGFTHIEARIKWDYGGIEIELLQDPAWSNLFLDTNNKPYVCIDGVNCTGKTSLLSAFPNIKVSKYCGNQLRYNNINPETALTYLLVSLQMIDECQNLVIDRSPIGNLAYQYCYYLMHRLQAGDSHNRLTMTALCEEYTRMHNLLPLLEYLNDLNLNLVILIDSDTKLLSRRLNERGIRTLSKSDVVKSSYEHYGLCQNAAYAYLANQLNRTCIDLNYFRVKYDLEDDVLLNTIQTYLKGKILNVIDPNNPRYPSIPFTSVITPQFEKLYSCALALCKR